ncbi:hypothetical protein GJ744_003074 [Endocarpon pusillum]|uniref:Uncharacterized protein n=1 Tax=Endocarpon pusillum TaxID=364733 RepID=A0A8H7A9F2_9EURO|nr:hypothetical protein GJ744_003074 [Endocarpon pusillum]
MLAKHFGQHDYLITPKMFVHETNKKANFTIEKLCEQAENKSKLHVTYELEKLGREVFNKAVSQVSDAISQLNKTQKGID